MNYRVDTPLQIKSVLRALRKARGLNQAQAGQLIGVSQRRVAAIEANPGATSFDQIAQLVLALGGNVLISYVGEGSKAAENRPVKLTTTRTPESLAQDTW